MSCGYSSGAGVALPEHGWTEETERQWNVAIDLWQAMAKVYWAHQFDCMIDLYAPPVDDERWHALVSDLGLVRVVLLPSLAVCLERNRLRGREPLLAEDDLRRNYDDVPYCVQISRPDHVIDNSHLTVDETVRAIDAEIVVQTRSS